MGNNTGSPMCDVNRDFVDGDFEDASYPAESWSPRGSQVRLNIYHLDDSWADTNVMSQRFGLGGAFHAGIEIHGREWTYGVSGIECGEPRFHKVHVFHESIPLGKTSLPAGDVEALVRDMRSSWSGQDYHLFDNNCTNFADEFSVELVGNRIPPWVGRLPQIASQASALGFNI
jgi:hypothetical protein